MSPVRALHPPHPGIWAVHLSQHPHPRAQPLRTCGRPRGDSDTMYNRYYWGSIFNMMNYYVLINNSIDEWHCMAYENQISIKFITHIPNITNNIYFIWWLIICWSIHQLMYDIVMHGIWISNTDDVFHRRVSSGHDWCYPTPCRPLIHLALTVPTVQRKTIIILLER